MILVLSYDTYEQGTDPVLNWLLHYNVPFIKLSLHDLVRHKIRYYVDLKNQDIIVGGVSIRSRVKAVWHRRFVGEISKLEVDAPYGKDQLNLEIKTEVCDLVDYLHTLLKNKPWLTSFEKINANKLEMLNIAEECGLQTPQSRIINNRKDLISFSSQVKSGLVSKPISDSRKSYLVQGDTYVILTNEICKDRIAALPEYFFPSLFQEKIEADFEIRTFYLDGAFYPTAVLNSSTHKSVDKKLDSSSEHTHLVPYQLPHIVEERLNSFMEKMGLNTACIDIIRTKSGEFVFIEANPVGQYLAESKVCNYNIEERIAQWLINQ